MHRRYTVRPHSKSCHHNRFVGRSRRLVIVVGSRRSDDDDSLGALGGVVSEVVAEVSGCCLLCCLRAMATPTSLLVPFGDMMLLFIALCTILVCRSCFSGSNSLESLFNKVRSCGDER